MHYATRLLLRVVWEIGEQNNRHYRWEDFDAMFTQKKNSDKPPPTILTDKNNKIILKAAPSWERNAATITDRRSLVMGTLLHQNTTPGEHRRAYVSRYKNTTNDFY